MKPLAIAITTLALLSLSQQLYSATQGKHIVMKENFEASNQTALAQILLSHKHITLAKGAGPDGSDAIKVAYVGYPKGSERVVKKHQLGSIMKAATLSFDVRFDQNFKWTLGGKLHGLGSKNAITGGKKRQPNGWSARIMFKKEGRCATYLYDQDMTKKWGTGQTTDNPVFKAGQWHHVTLQVQLNEPGIPNGFTRILIDNKEVMITQNITFRKTGGSDTGIQEFLFSTFHGGNNPKYTPVDKNGNPTTVYAYFDNFSVTEGIHRDPKVL